MNKIKFLIFLLFISLGLNQVLVKKEMLLMGSDFAITVVAEDSVEAKSYIALAVDEISRIENLISSWDNGSQTSKINNNSGIKPVIVDKELLNLVERANRISKITDGAFDISFASTNSVWKFDGSMHDYPSVELILSHLKKVGYNNIILNNDNNSIFLKLKGMKIGFGGIGKGYAADKAKALLIKNGVTSGIINAAGDINAWGLHPSGDEWKIAITNPFDKNNAIAIFPLKDRAVVTSGDYEKYIILDGKRYSHIIDPRTGNPSRGLISATVFANNAELADALATSLMVIGEEAGINLINQIPDIDCILIDESGQIIASNNIILDLQ